MTGDTLGALLVAAFLLFVGVVMWIAAKHEEP